MCIRDSYMPAAPMGTKIHFDDFAKSSFLNHMFISLSGGKYNSGFRNPYAEMARGYPVSYTHLWMVILLTCCQKSRKLNNDIYNKSKR